MMQRLMKDRIAILGNLVTGVAHEINNPLTIILGNLDVAKKEILQETEKKIDTNKILESLKDAQHAAERIFNIVNSLTIFSTIKEFNCGKYNINEILDSVVVVVSEDIREKTTLIKSYGNIKPVYTSEEHIFQVFFNLLINAAQAILESNSSKNEIRIETGMTSDNKVSIKIFDTGPGIPLSIQQNMFTPFFTTKPVGIGTGLGLVYCQKIIKSFNGELFFESEKGKGTCFTVLLPAVCS